MKTSADGVGYGAWGGSKVMAPSAVALDGAVGAALGPRLRGDDVVEEYGEAVVVVGEGM